MRWLVTVQDGCDPSALRAALEKLGASLDPSKEAVPVDSGESVYTVDGPGDLNKSARGLPGVVRISPASRMYPFRAAH